MEKSVYWHDICGEHFSLYDKHLSLFIIHTCGEPFSLYHEPFSLYHKHLSFPIRCLLVVKESLICRPPLSIGYACATICSAPRPLSIGYACAIICSAPRAGPRAPLASGGLTGRQPHRRRMSQEGGREGGRESEVARDAPLCVLIGAHAKGAVVKVVGETGGRRLRMLTAIGTWLADDSDTCRSFIA